MPATRDSNLIETVQIRRARLAAALLHGEVRERRVVNNGLKRLMGGVVLAAVVSAGCVGFSFVSSMLAKQAAEAAEKDKSVANVVPGVSDRPYLADYFARTTKDGWGTADLGGDWKVGVSNAHLSTSDGRGLIELQKPGAIGAAIAPTVLRESADVTMTLISDPQATLSMHVIGRRTEAGDYRVKVLRGGDGAVSLTTMITSGGVNTVLSDTVRLRGSLAGQSAIKVRVQTYGVKPTVVRAKLWAATNERGEENPEPATWAMTATDNVTELQRAGSIGLVVQLSRQAARSETVEVREFVARPVVG